MYGGVIYNISHFILPVQNDKITLINNNQMKTYFPSGYTIKRPPFSSQVSEAITIQNAKVNSCIL